MSRAHIAAGVLVLAVHWPCFAAPNLPEDDPSWTLLRDLRQAGRVGDFLGAVQLLGEDEARGLLASAGLAPPGLPPLPSSGFWVRPVERVTLRSALVTEDDRPYSLPQRPYELAGFIGLSCEFQAGRPCGDGGGAGVEVDSSLGFGNVLSASTRLRASAGNNLYGDGLALDRAYLKAQLGPVAAEFGRDVLAAGPSFRAARMLSLEPAPADGLRIWTRPLSLLDADALQVSFLYFLVRLRDPQTFAGTLLDCTRMQLDFFRRLQLGGSRTLEFGGRGAPHVSFADFIGIHFVRLEDATGQELADNRLSFDLSALFPELAGARFYYELAFDDTRRQFIDALKYDADHLLGAEVRGLHLGPVRRLFIEAEFASRISQTDPRFRAGNTNAGRPFGSALGPDSRAVWLRVDLEQSPRLRISPWAQWIVLSNKTYADVPDGGIIVTSIGPAEHRQRLGVDAFIQMRPDLFLEVRGFGERVGNFQYNAGSTHLNAGLLASLVFAANFPR